MANRFEPNLHEGMTEDDSVLGVSLSAMVSIAISLKRIADTLTVTTAGNVAHGTICSHLVNMTDYIGKIREALEPQVLTQVIGDIDIGPRLAALESQAHPPIDLKSAIVDILDELRDGAECPLCGLTRPHSHDIP